MKAESTHHWNRCGLFLLCSAALIIIIITSSACATEEEERATDDDDGGNRATGNSNPFCEDEETVGTCDEVVNLNCDPSDVRTQKCHRSCHHCIVDRNQREWSSEGERASKCKDMVANCDVMANPAVCCAIKPMANATCQRSCRFCYDANSIPVVSGIVPMPSTGTGGGGDGPVIYQDPCNPTAPPSAGGMPAVPGGGGAAPGNIGSGALPGGGGGGSGGSGGNNGPVPSNPIG